MKFKKILCMMLVVAIAAMAFVGCKKDEPEEVADPFTPSDIAMEQISESKLSDEEMLAAVKNYYAVFDEIFEATGEHIVTEVAVDKDGKVSIDTVRPELDENGEVTGKDVKDEGLMTWGSVREAFAYLVQNGQLDLDGNMLFDKGDLIKQATEAQKGGVSDTTVVGDEAADSEADVDADAKADATDNKAADSKTTDSTAESETADDSIADSETVDAESAVADADAESADVGSEGE